MATPEEIEAMYLRVATYQYEGMRFMDFVVAHTHWHTRWKDEPATLLWATVHMVAHGGDLPTIVETVMRGDVPEGMVPLEDADRQLAEIRRLT